METGKKIEDGHENLGSGDYIQPMKLSAISACITESLFAQYTNNEKKMRHSIVQMMKIFL